MYMVSHSQERINLEIPLSICIEQLCVTALTERFITAYKLIPNLYVGYVSDVRMHHFYLVFSL